jgi:hypothetical protein
MFPGRVPILQWGIKKGDAQSFSVQEERTTPSQRNTKEARQNNLSISLINVLRSALCRTQQVKPLQQSLLS